MPNKVTETNSIKQKCLIFVSWQSDRKECRNFVDSVVKKIPKKVADIDEMIIERDTSDVPGAPDIGNTIYERIEHCDLFIADVTLINDEQSGYRRTPNPNVMIEVGYAIRALGWERVILLQCEDYGDIEELPFDINHRRICNYTLGLKEENEENKKTEKQKSKENVISNISETIEILRRHNLLFGGKKRIIPKFEIWFLSCEGTMGNLKLKIRNVSAVFISRIKSQSLAVHFYPQGGRNVEYNPQFGKMSLMQGEETVIHFYNGILGAGPGFNNAVWCNFDLEWQFSCEDENDNVYYFEVKKHIDYADHIPSGEWLIKYIG